MMNFVQLPTPPAETIRPVGPIKSNIHTLSLDGLPPLVLGGAQFNHQYNDDPFRLPVKDIIKSCFECGVCAIDTSSYYGPSEILIGEVLGDAEFKEQFPRDTYFLITKAGRIAEQEFNYSPEWIRKSVNRSLERMHTSYLDIVYAHDVEFVPLEEAVCGIAELFRMKDEGIIRNVGISGYPVAVLVRLAELVKNRLNKSVDVVLSYSNFTLQNTLLKNYLDDFYTAGVKKVLNGSPLSMALLRSQLPHAFHPASTELKAKVHEAAKYSASQNVELADLAMRFALRNWHGTTVIGWSSLFEVNRGVQAYWDSQNKELALEDEEIIENIRDILGSSVNETWPSGLIENYP
ncbi:Aldo/keto reductase family-domain-containing protein [Dipodascopsis uninucleata]